VKCAEMRRQITAYLDGELEGDRGSAVRGHLRTCDACRTASEDEAKLRDGLRGLPPLDPPASLWAGVQARLAQAEMADAERPAWRRALARWMPRAPQLGMAAVAIAAVVAFVMWRSHHDEVAQRVVPAPAPAPMPLAAPAVKAPAPAPSIASPDVTADLAAAPARQTQDYAAAVAELMPLAEDARTRWTEERKRTFDARVAELRKQIDGAAEGRPRQHAYRALIRYLQTAAVRDEIALADVGGAP
jgi:anti-sigma factor RsiW